MDGNEVVCVLTEVPQIVSKGKSFLFSVLGVLLSIGVSSTVFNIHWAILFAISFLLGCFTSYYISKNAALISSFVYKLKQENTKTRELVQHTGCLSCDVLNCNRHSPDLNVYKAKPWMDLHVPQEIDEALEQILNLVIERHIYLWYRKMEEVTQRTFQPGCAGELLKCLMEEIQRFI